MLKRYSSALLCGLMLLLCTPLFSQWRPAGPFGGNARALAYDPSNPDHILLGSGAGALFQSIDGGRHWKHFAHLGPGHELMLENIAFDPSHPETIYVAGWSITGSGGGFFVTRDGGKSWSEPEALRGKSIQALALADSDPKILIAGSLDGLYRSVDRGEHWSRISPVGHPDLKNFESVAIDPKDPQVIYAGTWHLPWKTTDGGATWNSIKEGVIDDSDVFSIIVDPANPQTVFASACSGIYKSEDAGTHFRKVQGIPGTARRTRVLQQDPGDSKVVYAGTTEGLWKTFDGGKTFKLISPPNYILNDVMVDPRNSKRVLIATDRAGVFASDDAGVTFRPSNDGFSQRQITAVAWDPVKPDDFYVSVVNDKEFGGVFRSHEGAWSQVNGGLGSREIFDLAAAPGGSLVAATNHGLFLYKPAAQQWEPSKDIVRSEPAAVRKPVRGKNGKLTPAKPLPPVVKHSTFEGRVAALAIAGRRWYAATDAGVLASGDHGKTWTVSAIDGEKSFVSVSTHEHSVAASSLRDLWYSGDDGATWSRQAVPAWITRIYSVTVPEEGEVWLSTREGALHWVKAADGKGEWQHVLGGLPSREITSIRVQGNVMLAVAGGSSTVYVSTDHGQSWSGEPSAAFEVNGAGMLGSDLYATTWHNGLLLRVANHSTAQGQH